MQYLTAPSRELGAKSQESLSQELHRRTSCLSARLVLEMVALSADGSVGASGVKGN
ncbi:MAG: hypothetical protein AB1589_07360 [Cyanobacteriota bacterium]